MAKQQAGQQGQLNDVFKAVGNLNPTAFADWEDQYDISPETMKTLKERDRAQITSAFRSGGFKSAARYIFKIVGPILVADMNHDSFTQSALDDLKVKVFDTTLKLVNAQKYEEAKKKEQSAITTSITDTVRAQQALHQLSMYEREEVELWLNSLKVSERVNVHRAIAAMQPGDAHQTLEDLAFLGDELDKETQKDKLLQAMTARAKANGLLGQPSVPFIALALVDVETKDPALAKKVDDYLSHKNLSLVEKDSLVINLLMLANRREIAQLLEQLAQSSDFDEFKTRCQNRALI
ncbi:hypothetical protein CL632_00920 [bacterium]|nr:hypothetical protein [bacterium]|tara:strand:+ start:631 stop:1509 length:879 start_codon:yes stop_codon:yes gene_type:complete